MLAYTSHYSQFLNILYYILLGWKPPFLYFCPTVILMSINALSKAEKLVSSCLIPLHLGVKHLHNVIKLHVIRGKGDTKTFPFNMM